MILRRPAIARCRAARAVCSACLNAWLADESNAYALRRYAVAWFAYAAALNALNAVETSVWRTVRDRPPALMRSELS